LLPGVVVVHRLWPRVGRSLILCVDHPPRPAKTLLDRLREEFFIEQLKALKRIWRIVTHQVLPINALMLT
jgi:uncharacterized protein (DUF2249 family)